MMSMVSCRFLQVDLKVSDVPHSKYQSLFFILHYKHNTIHKVLIAMLLTWNYATSAVKKKNVRLDQVRCAGAHPHS